MSRARLIAIGGGLVALICFWSRAQVADDFDSMNLLLGMSRAYDLSKLQPHFPGYPVYVALGALLCRLGLAPITAATLISSIASGATTIGLAVIAERIERGAALAVIALRAVAWLPWFVGSSALSDALGTAFA